MQCDHIEIPHYLGLLCVYFVYLNLFSLSNTLHFVFSGAQLRVSDILFYKFSPDLLNGRIHKDKAPAKQSLLRWPCPLPSDRAIPDLWQNLEPKVQRMHKAAHGRSPH